MADPQPPAQPPSAQVLAGWRDVCDARMTVEVGIAVLAAERAQPAMVDALEELVVAIDDTLDDFPAYRQIDVRFHVGLAEADRQLPAGQADDRDPGRDDRPDLLIAHPPEVLDSANHQHRRMLAAIRRHDEAAAAREMTEHLRGTEHILAALLPSIRTGGQTSSQPRCPSGP